MKNTPNRAQSGFIIPAPIRSGITKQNMIEEDYLNIPPFDTADTPPYLSNAAPLPLSRMLTDHAKIYTDEDKFRGERYDILDSKVKIFGAYYQIIGIPQQLYHKVYSVMLKDRAKQFYFDRLI